MKNYFIAAALIGSLLTFQYAHADTVSQETPTVPECAKIENINQFPRVTFYAVETSPTLQTVHIWKVENGDCVSETNPTDTLNLYAVDSVYAKTLPTQYNPINDTNTYKSDIEIDPKTYPGSIIPNMQRNYGIEGIDNYGKMLIITDNTSTEPVMDSSKLDDHIIQQNPPLSLPPNEVFTDVSQGSTYYNALTYLKSKNYISGYPDGSFKPGNLISRAELLKTVLTAQNGESYGLCMLSYTNPDGSYQNLFTDINDQTFPWYLNYVCYAKLQNIMKGYADGSFRPDQPINFAEAAKVIATELAPPTHQAFNTTPWYKGYINFLAAQKAIPTTLTRFDQKITRGEMAEIIYRIKSQTTDLPSKNYNNLQ